jgi:flagellar hook-basal body complex protein FliE
MTDRIGATGTSGLARAAIEAALARQAAAKERIEHALSPEIAGARGLAGPTGGVEGSEFSKRLSEGIRAVDAEVKRADQLADDLIAGRVNDLSEVAATLKQSDLSLRFALEVRNKFIDAYREVMRMSV